MADKDFTVKNGIVVNTAFSANSSGIYFSNTLTINSTIFSGTANNASYLGGTTSSGYQTTAGLSANVATLTANNTSFVGSVSAANVVSNAQLSSNLSNYQTTAGLSANVAKLSSNNTTYVNSKTEGNLNVNNAVYFNGTSSSSYVLLAGNQNFTGGFTFTAYNLGTGSATVTPSPINGNYQYITNNGAFTIAAPSSDCAIDILVTNGASAGTITTSGFTAPSSPSGSGGGGDAYTTTNTYKYLLMIRRINGTSTFAWKALQ